MVQAVSAGGHVGVVAMTALRYAQSDGGDVIVPVRPADALSASFRHIRTRPDTRLEDGIPLYKLRILDMLIDHLARSGTAAGAAGEGPIRNTALRPQVSAGSVDQLLAAMSSSLRKGSGAGASYRAAFLPEPGAFVDLAA
jgi:hypothetical protein